MAVYKIPQDVEADDKFVGPLSFKQFIFVGIAAIAGYLSYLLTSKGFWPSLIILLPIIVIMGFLGFPWGRDQPTEIWLAARIRFLIKPRVRIWNQSGVKELVTITVPKKVEKHYTDGLSQNEVSSRLNGLATLLDSRGWAVKNVNTNVYNSPLAANQQNTDRLLDMTALPQEVTETAGADVLDETVSATALHFDEMIKSSEQKHRQEAMDRLNSARMPAQPTRALQPQQADFWYLQQQGGAQQQPPIQAQQQPTSANDQQSSDFWFLNGSTPGTPQQNQPAQAPAQQQLPPTPPLTTFQNSSVVAPQATQPNVAPIQQQTAPLVPYVQQQITAAEEEAMLQKIHEQKQLEHDVAQYSHLKTILPISEQQTPQKQVQNTPVTAPVKPAIMNLANNDDLNVATLAREAQKQVEQKHSDGEVTISLR